MTADHLDPESLDISKAETTQVHAGARRRLGECVQEVTRGVGPAWHRYRVVGATRSGLAPAKEGVGKHPERYKLVEPGTIFYNPMRILLGSIALLDEGQEPGITSPDYVVFKPVPGRIHSRWLYHWLRSDDGAAFIRTLTRGAVRERMLFRRLAFAEIEVPPFEVQAKFSRAIEFLERVRMAAEAELEAANQLFATYRRAVFCAARAKGWATYRLGDLLARPVKTGISKPTSPSSARRCLTLSAVRDGILDVATAKPVAVSDADADGNWVTPGGFYVVRGNGQLRLVGRGALAPAVINPPVLYPDLLFEVIPDPSRVDPRYLRFVWDTDEVRADIERRARTSAGIFKINQANLVEITFAVPPKGRAAADCSNPRRGNAGGRTTPRSRSDAVGAYSEPFSRLAATGVQRRVLKGGLQAGLQAGLCYYH